MMLHNHPISMGVDYFVNNLKGDTASRTDMAAGGFLNHKAKSKFGENGKSILKGELYGPVGYPWVFKVLRG